MREGDVVGRSVVRTEVDSRRGRRNNGVLGVGLALVSLLVLGAASLPSMDSRPWSVEPLASVTFTLHGSLSGWGFTAQTITTPGPTLTVTVGDVVTMRLFAPDRLPHTFFVDYDGDTRVDTGEPLSPTFSSSTTATTYTFTADRAGSFVYWCSIHFGNMRGSFVVQPPPNAAPTLSAISVSPETITPGTDVAFSASSSDPDGDPLSYVWSFGDGATRAGQTEAGGGTITATHAYSAVGQYPITLTVDDGKGGTANAATTLFVVPQIDVAVSGPWTQLYAGQTMDLSVLATVGGAPLSGAAVTLTGSPSCTLTPSSGLTGPSGGFGSTIRCTTGGMTATIRADVSLSGYGPGSATYGVSILSTPLPLSVSVTSKTNRMMSLETATIRVRLTTTGGVGVTGGLLTPTSSPTGTFGPVTELGNGDYSVSWTAPTVTGTTVAAIRLTAKVGGYASPPTPTAYTITVDPNKTNPANPTTLFSLGLAEKTALRSGETILIRLYLYTIEGYPVAGASVVVTVLGGGSATIVVDEFNGLYTFRYTAPTVAGDTAILLRATASKAGYRVVVRSIGLTVSPAA